MAKKSTKAAAKTVEETTITKTSEVVNETTTKVDDLKSGDIVSKETNPEEIKIEESEPVDEKIEIVKDVDSKEPVVTETPDTTTETEVPQDTTTPDTPADTTEKPAGTETPDTGDTEPTDKTPTDPVPPQDPVTEPVKEEKPAVALSSVYPVRYHVTFSQKRMAFVREMPIYNMLSTWCFNKSSFIGCTSKKDYEEIESCVKALPDDKVRVEGIMLSAAAKEQFLIKLKANTDYCVLKWGDKRK